LSFFTFQRIVFINHILTTDPTFTSSKVLSFL